MSRPEYGESVVCRRCGSFVAPRNVADGTLDENRTGVCLECD